MRAFAWAALILCAAGCRGLRPVQRVPGPMRIGEEPLAAPAPDPLGANAADVVRHADPVSVRRRDASAGFPLAFHRKRERLAPGGDVQTSAGGRAEILWEGVASSIVMADEGLAHLGDADLDETLVSFRSVTYARLMLAPKDRIALPGGAELAAGEEQAAGPIVVRRVRDDLLQVTNEASGSVHVLIREGVLELASGERVILPMPASGMQPSDRDPKTARLAAKGLEFSVLGSIEPVDDPEVPAGVRMRAKTDSELEALGVRVKLAPGDEAVFSRLDREVTEPPPAPERPSQAAASAY